ncbi:hypothetical protein CCR75_001441 [Bremia lactucae]|uniref:Uncharacterized protein n=1 Tax=Bremia lactucae TaxID=4779 RepID=A0A976IM95_BRELC|nr:hypothetical protein CCR75_001441 [Bremia lactucae]
MTSRNKESETLHNHHDEIVIIDYDSDTPYVLMDEKSTESNCEDDSRRAPDRACPCVNNVCLHLT